MPNGILVHAFPHVAGETDGLASPVPSDCFLALRAFAKRPGKLAGQRGDTPVTHDAARRSGE
jgi:hypothetical protein